MTKALNSLPSQTTPTAHPADSFDTAMFHLTIAATYGSYTSTTGDNCQTSGYSPQESAPTAAPRMQI